LIAHAAFRNKINGCAVVRLEPGYVEGDRDFVFFFNLFSLPSPPNCYMFLRPIR